MKNLRNTELIPFLLFLAERRNSMGKFVENNEETINKKIRNSL